MRFQVEDVLNWTLSHRQDATVFAPYYRYEPLSAKDIDKASANKICQLTY